MFRLTALLCASLFVTLLVAGQDRGQLRPGLARAVAEGREIVVLQRRSAAPVAPPAAVDPAEQPPVVATVLPPAPPSPAPEPAAPEVAPQPAFTLSTLPSLGGDKVAADADLPATPAPPAAELPAEGEVWYIAASSVNVREDPSTEAMVLGKLASGEAVTVISGADGDWARILIEGDGLEGYVASRFLSPVAP